MTDPTITTLIFDFSGVLTTKAFFPYLAEQWGKQLNLPADTVYTALKHDEQYMLGNESSPAYWEHALKPIGVSQELFNHDFATWYYGVWNDSLYALLPELKARYRLLLHSDNYEALSTVLCTDTRLTSMFERMYFSNEIHLAKTDPAAFQYVLSDSGVAPQACIFTDDKLPNIQVAASVGINTMQFTTTERFISDLGALGADYEGR